MENSPGDRFADAVEYLIEHRYIRNQSELVRLLNLSKGYVSTVLNERKAPSSTIVSRFTELFPQINKRWLIMGEGEMLKTDDTEETNKSSQGGLFIPAELVQMFSDMAATIRSQQEMIRQHQEAAQDEKGKSAG